MFAEVFAYQRGHIFGFGPNANDDTKNVLKISQNFPETEEAWSTSWCAQHGWEMEHQLV